MYTAVLDLCRSACGIHYVRFQMRTLTTLLVLPLLSAFAAFSQEPNTNAMKIATALNTPEYQWVFNHICVPVKVLGTSSFTNGDFVDAYYVVSELRWKAALAAQARGETDASMKSLALILHGITDAYWPNRVRRDNSGAIVGFRDCDDLGNLKGALREERAGPGPQGESREKAILVQAEVIRRWKENRPFEEVAPILRAGPMRLSEDRTTVQIGAPCASASANLTRQSTRTRQDRRARYFRRYAASVAQ
jgi:hypothetical protein